MRDNYFRWFGYVQCILIDAPVRRDMILVNVATRRGTPTITWIITTKKDVMELRLTKDTHNSVE